MTKVSIDGLLGLNREEIEIIFRRCRGETVEEVAKAMGIGASTISNTRMPTILEMLEVENWREAEKELCIPLRKIIHSVSALKVGWPEEFREKIEALREPVEPPKGLQETIGQPPATSRASGDQQIPPNGKQTPETSASTPAEPSSRIPSEQVERELERRPRWVFIAIPLFVFCLLCLALVPWGWIRIRPWLSQPFTPQPTETLAPPLSTDTATIHPTNTTAVIATETSLLSPTVAISTTVSPSPTIPPEPTNTPRPAPLQTTFPSDLPDWITLISGGLEFPGPLVAVTNSKLVIGEDDWQNYEIIFEAEHHKGCFGLGDDGISAHAIDEENMLVFIWNYCETRWRELTNGSPEWVTQKLDGPRGGPGFRVEIRMVAEDGRFRIYIDGRSHEDWSYFDDEYLMGKAYMYVAAGTQIHKITVRR